VHPPTQRKFWVFRLVGERIDESAALSPLTARRLLTRALGFTSRGVTGFVVGLAVVIAGCSDDGDPVTGGGGGGGQSSGPSSGGSNSGGSSGQFTGGNGSGGSPPACVNLECQQVDCPTAGATTTISGKVYVPAGSVPLYNAVVYVPNAPLSPIVDGATCDTCASMLTGSPLVSALTDTAGSFILEDVPVGSDIPVVIQIGKWRREIVIPAITECQDNPITDVEQTSLPSNQSEGHIPKIALTTGGADPLECLLRKIGLEDSEFTLESGTGRVNLFGGNGGSNQYTGSLNGGASMTPTQTFWSDAATLNSYDIVLLACEGAQNIGDKPQVARDAMRDYTSLGGRVFASHWHNVWLEQGPADFQSIASWGASGDPPDPFDTLIDTSFPKGVALSEWLVNVGASPTLGQLSITEPRHTIASISAGAQRWIYGAGFDAIQYFTFNTPIATPPEEQCGRMVFSDLHVSSGDSVGDDFPEGCTTTSLSPQEKALLFMLFDLSSCIQPDDDPPCPPTQNPCGEAGDPACGGTCVDGCCQPIPQ